MSKSKRFAVGEVWYDQAGNECFFRENGTISCRTINNEPSLAIQAEKDACDINKIVARFAPRGKTVARIASEMVQNGVLASGMGRYGDFSNAVDYHDAVFRAQQAQEAFDSFPAAIRSRFGYDPGKLIDFLADENNRAEAIELGLVTPPQASQVPQGDVQPPSQEGG